MYEIRFAGRCDPNPGGVMNCAFIIYERKALGRNPDREIGRGCQVFPAAERNTVNVAAWYALGFALKWLKDRRLKGNVVAMTHHKIVPDQFNGANCQDYLARLLGRCQELIAEIGEFSALWIQAEQNAAVRELAKVSDCLDTAHGW